MSYTSDQPTVRLVQGRQIVNGEPTDTSADLIDRTATITDTPDRSALAQRAFECGRLYGKAEAAAAAELPHAPPGASLIVWPPPMLVPIMPLAPVRGRAVARPLAS